MRSVMASPYGLSVPIVSAERALVVAFGRSLLDYVALRQDLEDLLGYPIDLVNAPDCYPAIRERVLAEALPL